MLEILDERKSPESNVFPGFFGFDERKISAWRTEEHRWQGNALHAMLEQRFIGATGSPLAGQPPEMRSRAPQFSG